MLSPQDLLQAPDGETSETVRQRCGSARERALSRQGVPNQALQGKHIDAHLALTEEARSFLNRAATRLGWSARGTHRALKVARTLADLQGSAATQVQHVAEAMQYRRALQAPS